MRHEKVSRKPVAKKPAENGGRRMKSKLYRFHVEIVEEEDGRWSAWVEALPGCATWGYTREEALKNIRDAVEAYVCDMQEAGETVPSDTTTQVVSEPVVTVSV